MTFFVLALALPVGAALGLALASYALFLAAVMQGRNRLFGRACPGRALVCLAKGLGSAVAAQLVMIGTAPLGPLLAARTRRARLRTGLPVVVCLHGLYHSPAAFLVIRRALARAGCSRVLAPGYRSFGSDFETEAAHLAAWLRGAVSPDAPLCFLGHSLGGLMARRLAAEPDFSRRTLALVSLGTPHRGSGLAVLALGRLGRSLVPGSPLMVRLSALPDPGRAACLALCSPVDGLVVPDAGLDPARPGWRVALTPPVSHVAMLYHPAVVALAVAAVARALGPQAGRTAASGDAPA